MNFTEPLVVAESAAVLETISTWLYSYWLIYTLVGAGLLFTIATKGVQIRHFPRMWKQIVAKDGAHDGITSFQAFTTGMASRVGIGNIVGVAIALTLGGPGAIFWMWVVAFLGMATGFVEATLAQVFKVRNFDGTYRGGPAYYITTGLKQKWLAVIFATVLIFTYGFAFNMVAANTISDTLNTNHGLPTWVTAIALMLLGAPLLLRGIRPIARFSAKYMPIIAGIYVLIALIIVLMHVTELPSMIALIFRSAFGLDEAVVGFGAGILAAMMNGTKRGLFSNEAGMGSAPNMAATATVSHPVKQGLIQSIGVFIDTIIVCSATAFMILSSGVYNIADIGNNDVGAALTNASIVSSFGDWAIWITSFIIFAFAFTTIFGNYSYAEVNLNYLGVNGKAIIVFRLLVILGVGLGSVLTLATVWNLADVVMALMATVNLISIVLLFKWFKGTLKDYEQKIAQGTTDQRFVGVGNPLLPGDVPGDVWAEGAQDHHAQDHSARPDTTAN